MHLLVVCIAQLEGISSEAAICLPSGGVHTIMNLGYVRELINQLHCVYSIVGCVFHGNHLHRAPNHRLFLVCQNSDSTLCLVSSQE